MRPIAPFALVALALTTYPAAGFTQRVETSSPPSSRVSIGVRAVARFGETLGHSAATFNSGVAGMTQRLSTVTPDPALALLEAQGIIARFIARQAITIAFDEVFRMMCWMFLAALLMVPFARRGAASAPPDTRRPWSRRAHAAPTDSPVTRTT